MPSVTYMNQSAPFWDFLASLEQEGTGHPFFSQRAPNQTENQNESAREGRDQQAHRHRGERTGPSAPPFGPWGWGFNGFGGGREVPHRGPPPAPDSRPHEEKDEIKDSKAEGEEKNSEKVDDNGAGPSGTSSYTEDRRGQGGQGRCGARRARHGCGSHGHGFGAPSPHGGPPHHGHHGRRGGWGPWAHGGPFDFSGAPFDPLSFAASLFDPTTTPSTSPAQATSANEAFTPPADIFTTPSAYIIHVSLPGAQKDDVRVHWDAEAAELAIAGVVHRPGDEALLQALEVGERLVGAFERRVPLGTRARPAGVDAEGITARLVDGVLRVEVPRLEEGFVEVRWVDVE